MWEEKKMLVINIFSFSNNVIYSTTFIYFIPLCFVVCKCFELVSLKFCSWKVLNLYPIFRTYDPEKDSVWKHCKQKRKCWEPGYPSFSTMFSNLSETSSTIWATSTLYHTTKFGPPPNWNHLQMTNLIWLKWWFICLIPGIKHAGHQYFLLFPQCFKKLAGLGLLKLRIVW